MWSGAAPAVGAAFAASLVEAVEAFTVVLAAASLGGWRAAGLGAATALAVLGAGIALLGPLVAMIPIQALQLTIGVLLLLFGLRWLCKAALRHAGIIPLHDEAAIFAAQSAELDRATRHRAVPRDWLAGVTALQGVLLEGLEVVFIVIAVGAGGALLMPASLGALAACALVLAVGAAVRRPLAQVPENVLKFGVGVMLSSFGLYWTGNGLGLGWPGQDLALPVFVLLFVGAGLAGAALARSRPAAEAAR